MEKKKGADTNTHLLPKFNPDVRKHLQLASNYSTNSSDNFNEGYLKKCSCKVELNSIDTHGANGPTRPLPHPRDLL